MDPLIVALYWNYNTTDSIALKAGRNISGHCDLSDVFHDWKMQTDWTDNIGKDTRVGGLKKLSFTVLSTFHKWQMWRVNYNCKVYFKDVL